MPDKKSILLVGKDGFLLPLYARSFKEAGFEVRLARSPEALLDATSSPPDLLLYDVDDEKVGSAFLKKIKKESVYGGTPVICLSHGWTRAHRLRLLQAGADTHFVKSHTMPSEIVEHAHRLLS